jgi:hypothetical protein
MDASAIAIIRLFPYEIAERALPESAPAVKTRGHEERYCREGPGTLCLLTNRADRFRLDMR